MIWNRRNVFGTLRWMALFAVSGKARREYPKEARLVREIGLMWLRILGLYGLFAGTVVVLVLAAWVLLNH